MTDPTPTPIDARLEPALDDAEAARIWQRIRDEQAVQRRPPRRTAYLAAAGLAVTAAAILGWARLAPDGGPRQTVATSGPLLGEIALEAGVRVEGVRRPAVAMSDGSRVELDPQAELEVLSNEGDKFVTAVRRGRAHFAVRPGGPRRWIIETDLATVEVVGTAFAVDRRDGGLKVSVERGVVLVRGERVPGRVVRLTAGEQIDIPAPIVAPVTTTSTDRTPPAQTLAAPIATTSGPSASATAKALGPNRPAAAPRGSPTAPAAIITAPTAPRAAPPIGADIIAAADARIAARDPAGAARLLDAYLAEAGGDASAGLASFLLGRIAQDSLGDPDRAAAAFERTLRIGSPRAVQEEALARRATALARAGRSEQASAAARRYLDRYPHGARAGAMTALLGP